MPNLLDTNSLEQSVSAAKEYVDNRVNSLDDIAILIKGDKGDPGEPGPKGEMGPTGPGLSGDVGDRGNPIYIKDGLPMVSNPSTSNCMILGNNALLVNTTGMYNMAFGHFTLNRNTTGHSNTVVGYNALNNNIDGHSNVAFGRNALGSNITGKWNTAIGHNTAPLNTSGNYNTALGLSALENNVSWHGCIGVGFETSVTGNYQLQLGKAGVVTAYSNGAVQNRSDERDKANITNLDYPYRDFINGLRSVSFQWDYREDYRDNSDPENPDMRKLAEITHDGTHIKTRRHGGFIAQEVKALADSLGFDFSGYQDHSINGGDDVLSLGYEAFIPPLVATVQDQDKEIIDLRSRLEHLETLVAQLVNK